MGSVWQFSSGFTWLRFICSAFILLWATTVAVAQTCPPDVNDEIQRCVQPVAQFAEALGVDVKEAAGLGSDRLMPSMGAHVFRQLCEKISTFSTCVRKAKRQCPTHITLTLINASYGYLCTDGYNVFVKNADCLMKLDQEESVRVCHDKTMTSIKNSSADARATMAQKLLKMCDSLNYFATCVEKPVLTECGSPAWSVIARVLHDTTKTLMPTCKFSVPLPEQRSSAVDGVSVKPSQSNNVSKSAGRQKISSVGTMTANKENSKNKGKSGTGKSSSLNAGPVGGAPSENISRRMAILAAASVLCFWWLERRSESFFL